MTTIQLEMEEDLVGLLQEVDQTVQFAAKELIVVELYRRGRISSGKAAQLLAISRWEFLQHASNLGIPYFNMSLEEWEAERKRIEERL